jgi:hypothetical protein
MTTLLIPRVERRLLLAVGEAVKAEPIQEWPKDSLDVVSEVFKRSRTSVSNLRQRLEKVLSRGVDPRVFAREMSEESIREVDEMLDTLRVTIKTLTEAEDPAAERFASDAVFLEKEFQAFRDLLSRAMSEASRPPGPVDWDRVRASEEAFASGKTKPISFR